MADDAIFAVQRAIYQRLTAVAEAWGTRVYPDIAPAKPTRPYVTFSFMGGGETGTVLQPDVEVVYGIKVVANEMATSLAGAQRLAELLNDAERTSPLAGGANWAILFCTREDVIHLTEMVDGVRIYHDGAKFRFRMEAI